MNNNEQFLGAFHRARVRFGQFAIFFAGFLHSSRNFFPSSTKWILFKWLKVKNEASDDEQWWKVMKRGEHIEGVKVGVMWSGYRATTKKRRSGGSGRNEGETAKATPG